MKVRPLHDRIIVQRIEEGEQKIGGIIIPDSAKEKPQQGKVYAVGAGKVKEANATISGLAATIWTRDIKRAHTLARRIQSGNVSINYPTVNPPEAPFGGYKQSGLGRLNGAEAIDQFLQTKSVWCEWSDEVQDPFVRRSYPGA